MEFKITKLMHAIEYVDTQIKFPKDNDGQITLQLRTRTQTEGTKP